jgi:hypothetical protein
MTKTFDRQSTSDEVLEDANVSAFAAGVLPYALDPSRADALWAKAGELVRGRD